jgi:hypothetical protein
LVSLPLMSIYGFLGANVTPTSPPQPLTNSFLVPPYVCFSAIPLIARGIFASFATLTGLSFIVTLSSTKAHFPSPKIPHHHLTRLLNVWRIPLIL